MHEAALYAAAAPSPTVVLGMLMRPYSLGHELLLIGEENPMQSWLPLAKDPIPPREALVSAVLICCQTWRENLRMVFDPWLKLKLWIWKRRIRKVSWGVEALKFAAYRRHGSLEFPISEVVDPNAPTARMPGAPFLLRLQQWVMLNLHLPEDAAWDYPYGLAIMRWETYWEEQGGLNVKNHAEMDFDKFVEEQEAKACQA